MLIEAWMPGIVIVGALGYVTGFIGGLVGLVLGVLRLPIVYGVELSPGIAAGTNIGVSAMGAVSASVRHLRERRIELRVFAIMGPSGAMGAFLGGFFSKQMPSAFLLAMIAAIVLWQGIGFARTKAPVSTGKGKSGPDCVAGYGLSGRRILWEASIGLGIGLLGGIVGLILGSLRLPAMIKILRMDPKVAAGTNLGVGSVTGVFGFTGHLLNAEVDLAVLVAMGAGAILGGYHGAKFTGKANPYSLKRWIGYVLVAVSAGMVWQGYSQIAPVLDGVRSG